MPKIGIDYSKTVIYKIISKDTSIKDMYVGHTTNFVQKKYIHKQNCINTKSTNYTYKLYEFIRANGGWDNWIMSQVSIHDCKDHFDAKNKEQEYIISLNATLNTTLNSDDEICEVNKHLCKICDYSCDKTQSMEKHLSTQKHKRNYANNITSNDYEQGLENIIISEPNITNNLMSMFFKERLDNQEHDIQEHDIQEHDNQEHDNQEHDNQEHDNQENIEDFKKLILEVIKSSNEMQKQNTEFQKQMLEVCKNSNNTIHNNSHNNNKTFNLQIFLNEECKDAMNMSEFIDSFDLQLSDLESVGELGYVEGMTKIFIDKLNSMDVCKRPMHCSDARREIIYIKDENRWEREKPSNPTLRKAVKRITFKNMRLTNLWSDTHPESKCNESRMNDVYIKLVIQSTGGSGEISDSEDKIIRRIVKGIVIDKSLL